MKSNIDKILPTPEEVDKLFPGDVIDKNSYGFSAGEYQVEVSGLPDGFLEEKTAEKIIESGNIKTVKDDNGNYFYTPDFSDGDLSIDFIKKCAELADGFEIKYTGTIPYDIDYISDGIKTGATIEDIHIFPHYPLLLSKTIDRINSMYMSGESKYYISSQHAGFIIFDKNYNPYGMSNVIDNDFDAAREEVLKKYFKVVENDR